MNHTPSACANCHEGPNPGQKLRACVQCQSAWYHGKDCQTEHWKKGHKRECKQLKARREGSQAASSNIPQGITPYVVPTCVEKFDKDSDYRIIYNDRRENSPMKVTIDGRKGRLTTLSFKLAEISPHHMPKIPNRVQPTQCISGSRMLPSMTQEEEIAMNLMIFNLRFYNQRKLQQEGNKFVLLVEYDVREAPDKSTLHLWITTQAEGLEDTLGTQTTMRQELQFWAVPGSRTHSMSRHQAWDPCRGLLPLGIDFVLSECFVYGSMMQQAKAKGLQVELHLYCRSPIFAPPCELETTEHYLMLASQWLQSLGRHYNMVVDLKRLPDGYTGHEVDDDPEAACVGVLRRMQERMGFSQSMPLLVTDEERCVPQPPLEVQESLKPRAFRIDLDEMKVGEN